MDSKKLKALEITAIIDGLNDALRRCDELGLQAAAIDVNQAIEKLKAISPKE